MISEAKPIQHLAENFLLDKPEIDRLKKLFNPKSDNPNDILKKHDSLVNILAHNITGIYGRSHFHSLVDLTFHSPLQIKFGGQLINTYMELLVVGDTNTGKNQVVQDMMDYYGLGVLFDSAATTKVGLIGGIIFKKEFGWGEWVRQHGGLLGLDEGTHLAENMDHYRAVRDGRADYCKADHREQTVCRTRLIILANDPGGYLYKHAYPIASLLDLFYKEADISRFTAVIIMREEDNPLDLINSNKDLRIKTNITKKDFRKKALFSWSLKPEDIIFIKEAVEACNELAKKMSDKYSPTIPLVQSAVQRKKLASLSTSLAAQLFNYKDGKLYVTAGYVRAAAKLLDNIYSSDSVQYDDYSRIEKDKYKIIDKKKLYTTVFEREKDECGDLKHCTNLLLTSREITTDVLEDAFNFINGENGVKTVRKSLLRSNCLEKKDRSYIKTKPFIGYLKELRSRNGN